MKGKVILITGGTRGLGFSIAQLFAQNGAKVILNYNQDDLQANQALEEIKKYSPESIARPADIRRSSERQQLIQSTIRQFGYIDVLINNAGILGSLDFLEMTEAEYDEILECNLKSAIFLAQGVAKEMITQKSGSIVNIASIGGLRALGFLPYATSKAGLIHATKIMARDLAPYKIRVNSVSPGTVITDMNRAFWTNQPERLKDYEEKVPLKRVGLGHEIAAAVHYLCSDFAQYTNGADIVVDGGLII